MEDITKYLSTYEQVIYQDKPASNRKGIKWLLELILGLSTILFSGYILIEMFTDRMASGEIDAILITIVFSAIAFIVGIIITVFGLMDLFAKTTTPDNFIYVITNIRVIRIDTIKQTIDYIRLSPMIELNCENVANKVGDLVISRKRADIPVQLEKRKHIRDSYHQNEVDYNESISLTFNSVKNIYDVRQTIVDLVNNQMKENKFKENN